MRIRSPYPYNIWQGRQCLEEEDLKEALSRRVGTEIAVEENEVHKLQQESYDGIVIRKENESIGVNVDATRLYSDLEQGRAYEDVLHYAVDIAQKGFEDAPKVDISQIMNYEVMKHSLIGSLVVLWFVRCTDDGFSGGKNNIKLCFIATLK